MRRLAPAALLLAAALLLTSCGLPLTGGARSGGELPDERSRPAGIKVLPPGPQPGASAEEIVRGFLRAQSSPDDDHAVARQFLAPGATWDDDSFVVVYEPGSQTVRVDPEDPQLVDVRLQPTARIEADGAYRMAQPDRLPPVERFRVTADARGELRLSQVPPGLRLQTADVARSYVPGEVFFLGRSTVDTATARLVPDRVFLPVTVEPARALVTALLTGASGALRDAVESAVPEGTQVRRVEVSDGRLVTVDLTRQVEQLSPRDRQRLSAQVTWTLQGFSAVRLLVEGRPFEVEAAGELQTVEDWDEYDPAGVADDASLYYLSDRRLRSLDEPPPDGDATSGAVPVDEAAVDPAGAQLGVVTRTAGDDEVRVGSLQGALGAPVFRRPDLGSLSWGSGDRGLWLLERGAQPRVWVLPGAVAAAAARPVQVTVRTPAGAGPLQRLEVSRDGARIALVLGEGGGRRLHVGRVVPTATGLVVDDVQPVAPDLADVTDVAWESGTSLAVLARDSTAAGLLVLQVAVDGSSSAPLQRQGVEGVPQGVAAAPGRPLVVAAAPEGDSPQVFRDDGTLFRLEASGRAPFYPG